jgi:sigma-B regulation protein RsbU (phosphoserine phosphatase)
VIVGLESSGYSTPGDALLLYTDGITETQGSSGVEYGIGRLLKALDTLLSLSSEEIVQMCVNDLNDFRGRTAKNDDVTMMAIRFLGAERGGWKPECRP